MRKITSYHAEPKVLVTGDNVVRWPGFDTETLAQSLAIAGGQKILAVGSIVGTDNKPLKRARLFGDAAATATKIYVDNPWAFAPGDALKIVAPLGANAAAELASINGGGGAAVGTIQSIDGTIDKQTVDIALSSAIVGNVVTIDIYGMTCAYSIASTNLSAEYDGIVAAINKALFSCDDLRYLAATNNTTAVRIAVGEPNFLVDIKAACAQGSAASVATLSTAVVQGIGAIALAAPLAAAIPSGTKIGVLSQTPLGIIENEVDLTNYLRSVSIETAICPLIGGIIDVRALRYIDGQVASVLNKCTFSPAYV